MSLSLSLHRDPPSTTYADPPDPPSKPTVPPSTTHANPLDPPNSTPDPPCHHNPQPTTLMPSQSTTETQPQTHGQN